MNLLDQIVDLIIGPAKDKLKDEFIDGMDKSSKVLVCTRRLAEELNIFDSSTYTDILNQQAEKHYKAIKDMNCDQIMAYLKEGIINENQNN